MIIIHDSVTLDDLAVTKLWRAYLDTAEPFEVLGPKCHTAICFRPQRVVVWLPTVDNQPPRYCESCAQGVLRIYRDGFGLTAIKTERLEYRPAGEDDAAQRFALMEPYPTQGGSR
jgi:hypothetical protein